MTKQVHHSGWTATLESWLRRRREKALLDRYGGIQWCPWCRQCAQSGSLPWGFKAWSVDPSLDVLTCSVCAGTSVWLWGMGMHYMGRLHPPTAEHPDEPVFTAALARASTPVEQEKNDGR